MIIKNHGLELGLAVLGASLSLVSARVNWIDLPVAIIVSIGAAFISASVVIIKLHQDELFKKSKRALLTELEPPVNILSDLSELDGISLKMALEIVSSATSEIKDIKKGIIRLKPMPYYSHIDDGMKVSPKKSEILAINSINSIRWSSDLQKRYFEANKAAAERGVEIHRIFILKDKDNISLQKIENIKEQVNCPGIKVSIVWFEDLKSYTEVEDWVYFSKPEERLYVDYADSHDDKIVSHAILHTNEKTIKRKLEDFNNILSFALTKDKMIEFISQ